MSDYLGSCIIKLGDKQKEKVKASDNELYFDLNCKCCNHNRNVYKKSLDALAVDSVQKEKKDE